MDYVEFENYYIDEQALQLMLAGVGLKSWYGFENTENDKVYTQEEVNKLLVHLYQREYICWEGENIRLKNPLKSAVAIILKAAACMTIKAAQMERLCYFSEGKILMMEKGIQENGKLRFSLWNEKAFMEYLWSSDLFPEEEFAQEDLKDWVKGREEEIAVFTLRKCGNGAPIQEMKISESGIFTFVTLKEKESEKSVLYCRKQCENMLLKWFHVEG